jgi:outer membrane lipoprotein-sorting protein
MERSDKDMDARDEAPRDTELGERLRRLEVPEHDPGFFAALEARLQAETSSAAGERGAAPKRRSWLRLAWIPIPVAMVILVLLWVFAGRLGIDSFKPETASAAEIAQKVATAVAEAKALRGTLVIVSPNETTGIRDEMRWTFVSTAEGDFRLTGITRDEDLSYDHEAGVQRVVSVEDGGELTFASESTGLAVGPPDPAPAENILERNLGAVVRALLDSPDANVEEATYQGRPVWTLSTDVKVNLLVDSSGDHMEVTVDQETGFPLRVVETREGEFVQELHLEGLEIDPELAADAFHLEFPTGTQVTHTDHGFQRVDPADLAAAATATVGYVPVLPAEVPDGFVLTEVAVAEMGEPSGKEGMNPPAPGVVSAMYRRGFDRLIVSTRLVGDDVSLWSDPLASGEGFIDTPEKVVLTAGAFAGSTAELVVDARTVPHLWAMNDTLVVTVSGDLTRDELLAIAESLAPLE